MLKFQVAAVTAILFWTTSSASSAQQTACRWIGTTWTCETNPTITQQLDNLITKLESHQRQKQADYDRKVQSSYDAAVSEVKGVIAQRLRDGDCKGAIELSLYLSDISLANQVRKFCDSSPPNGK